MAGSIAKLNIMLGVDSAAMSKGFGGASSMMTSFAAGVGSAMSSVASSVMDAAGSVVGLTKAFLGLKTGLEAVNVGVEFEHQMSIVNAMTDATESQFHKLREEARRLGRDTEHTASQAAEAMSNLATHGFNPEAIIEMSQAVVNLASVLKVDMHQAAMMAGDAMKAFGLKENAEQMQRVADVMSSMLTGANTGGADMIQDAFKYIAMTANAAGKSIEETSAALMVLNNAGLKGSEAGSALSRFLTKMARQTPQAQAALDELGLSFEDNQGNFKHMADIVDELQLKLRGLGRVKKLELISKIFDVRAGRAAQVLATLEGGGRKIREFEDRLNKSGGTAGKIAGKQLDNVWGAIKVVQSSWEGLIEAIYASVQGQLKASIERLTSLFNKMRNIAGPTMEKIQKIFSSPAAVKLGDDIFQGLERSIPIIADGLVRIARALEPLFHKTVEWLGEFFDGGRAIEGFAYAAVASLEKLAQIISTVGVDILSLLDAGKVRDFITGGLAAMEFFANNMGRVGELIGAGFVYAVSMGADVFKSFGDYLINLIEAVVQAMEGHFKGFFQNLAKNFVKMGESIAKFRANPLDGFNFSWTNMPDFKVNAPSFKYKQREETAKAGQLFFGLVNDTFSDLMNFVKARGIRQPLETPAPPTPFESIIEGIEGLVGGVVDKAVSLATKTIDERAREKPSTEMAGAALAGTKEAAIAEAKFRMEGRATIEEQGLNEQKKAVKILEKIEQHVDPRNPPVWGDIIPI